MQSLLRSLVLTLALLLPFYANAETTGPSITFKDEGFSPQTLEIAADTQVPLVVDNQSSKAIEFESDDMKIEKIIKPGKQRTVLVGPLKAGSYTFFDEFNEKVGKGTVTVK